jgi:hypothetical protein
MLEPSYRIIHITDLPPQAQMVAQRLGVWLVQWAAVFRALALRHLYRRLTVGAGCVKAAAPLLTPRRPVVSGP